MTPKYRDEKSIYAFILFYFFYRKLKTLFKKIKREHHVKELAQESKDSLSSIQ